jgi:hypothetical protein
MTILHGKNGVMLVTRSLVPAGGFFYGIIMFLLLFVLFCMGLWHAEEPKPGTIGQESSTFSSARAASNLRRIAATSHPVGTEANAKVREYLVSQLIALGLSPQIQKEIAVNPGRYAAGFVQNVVVRVPGRSPGKAVMLVAHYDSVSTGSGAADDGASVVAILETLRALKAGAQLQNDVICLFTDAEEVGLLGAEAFVTRHPWAKDVGLVLNFEYRGNSGPMLMFETSVGNAELIRGFKTVPLPLGNSLLYEIYKYLPNDTDMTVFKSAGIPGMNFAAIEGYVNYHSPLDRIESLSQGTLQHQGETMLALVRHFGNAALPLGKSADSVYFDVPGLGLICYPVSIIWLFNVVAIGLFIACLKSGIGRQYIRGKRVAVSAIGFVFLTGLLVLVCQLIWTGVMMFHPDYQQMMGGDPYENHWYLLAFCLLASGLFVISQAFMMKWFGVLELAMGAVSIWVVMLVVVSIVLPGGSFLFFWPLLLVLCSLLAGFSGWGENKSATLKLILLLLGVVPAIILFAPLLRQIYLALTPQLIGVVVCLLLILLGVTTHLLCAFSGRYRLGGVLLAAGTVFLLVAGNASKFDDTHPRPDSLSFVQDGITGKSYWLSSDHELDAWTRTFFQGEKERRRLPDVFGSHVRLLWTASAPSMDLPLPVADVLEDKVIQGERHLSLRLKSPRHAPKTNMIVEGVDVLRSDIEGHVLNARSQENWQMIAYALPDEGSVVRLVLKSGAPFVIRLIDISHGLSLDKKRERPAGVTVRPTYNGDDLLVTNVIKFK